MFPFDPLLRQLLETASSQLEALRGRSVIVGVSGGGDSVALLHVLLQLSESLSIALVAAHFDHGLRTESADHATQVARLAHDLNVPIVGARGDVASLATRSRASVEAAARAARYEFLASVARSRNAAVAVGHNRNDQAETVLLNLARGSGLAGLIGMRPVSVVAGAPDIPLIRPLLGVSRQAIREYCERHKLPVLEDPSNASRQYARNRVRLDVIPWVETINRRAVEHITGAAEALAGDARALDEIAGSVYLQAVDERDHAVLIDRARVRAEPDAVLIRVLRRAVMRVAGSLDGLTRKHLEDLAYQARAAREGRMVQLPHGTTALTGGGKLILWRGRLPDDDLYPLPLLDDGAGGTARLTDGWTWRASPDACAAAWEYPASGYHEHARYSDARFELRSARPHERFRPLGMAREKSIQDFLSDVKVPRSIRGRVPIVEADGQVVWLVGWRLDDRWALASCDSRFVCLRVWRNSDHPALPG